MKNINNAIVERLCYYMDKRNITQYRLAQLSGVPLPTLKSIMQRKTKNITLKTIILLANGLQVKLSEFLDENIFNVENLNLD